MSDEKYNGWTNYATWRVNLEICDDYCSSLIGEHTFASRADLADALKEYAVEAVTGDSDTSNNLAASYAAAFLDMVNWYEIADHNADDLIREDSDDEEEDEDTPDDA